MILEDIRYYRPESLKDAQAAYAEASGDGLTTHFVGGATEVTTLARDGLLSPGALIDITGIGDTRGIKRDGNDIWVGAAETLSDVADNTYVPLLAAAARRIADRSVRNTITLGGNIAGMLPYREAVLPVLALSGRFELCGPGGTRTVAATEAFDRRLRSKGDEFLVGVRIDAGAAEAAWFYDRAEKDARVDYPLVTSCVARLASELRFAIGGAFLAPVLCTCPVDDATPSTVLGKLEAIGKKFREDERGSTEYRRARTQLTIQTALDSLKKEPG